MPEPGPAAAEFDAIILAGGRGTRLGGADKPGLVVGTATMAATVVAAAVAAGARQVILVGPDRPDAAAAAGPGPAGSAAGAGPLIRVREDPPGAGPVPALRAGLARASAPWVAVLAADLPFLRGDRLGALVAAARGGGPAGAVIADASGAPQWLAGCWRAGALTRALAGYQGSSLRGLLAPLRPALVQDPGPAGRPWPWLDCDTPAELAAARAWLAGRPPDTMRSAGAGPSRERDITVSTLDRWIQAACAELGLDPAQVPVRLVLDLARDVAHQVDRPGAPLTAFLLGLAVGSGQPLDAAAGQLTDLAARWENPGR